MFISNIISSEERRVEEKKLPKFGYFPKMAISSKGLIAALLAPFFCERINYITAMTTTKYKSLFVQLK